MPISSGKATRIGGTRQRVREWISDILGMRSGLRPEAFEGLEGRCLLGSTPLPAIGDLETPTNPVVRLETNFGDVDIELFIGAAPITVNNFLTYVTSQRFDGTFFHRNAVSPQVFVLQGGGFSFDNDTGLSAMDTDPPIVRETTGRSNLARTVAMARTSQIDSATSQFFINYVDNTFLDPTGPSNGYAVFGRIVQGWDNVLAIQAIGAQNLSGDSRLTGHPSAGAMNEVPVRSSYSSAAGLMEQDLVSIINAEVVKTAGNTGFFSHKVMYPDGFRSNRTTETLELVNPNSTTATYQVIARYETGERDQIISAGTINANTTMTIRLSDAEDSGLTIMRLNTPYSLVVESGLPPSESNPQPVAATINRHDFNATIGESFFNPAGHPTSELQTWDFARIERGDLSQEVLVWQNLTDQTATLTISFFTSQGQIDLIETVEPYRRGGLELWNLGLPLGVMSARISSTQPIVAALSDWDIPSGTANPGDASYYTPAFGVLGVKGGGATQGGLGDLTITSGFTSTISIFNPNGAGVVVTLRFWLDTRGPTEDPVTRSLVLSASSRLDYVLDTTLLGISAGERFAVTYSSGSAPVTLQYTSVDDADRYLATGKRADGVGTSFQSRMAPQVHFVDGRWDPARDTTTQNEFIGIFNPFSRASVTLDYIVRYTFVDGTTIDAATGTLGANARVTLRTSSFTGVMSKVGAGAQFQRYTISVIGTATDSSPILGGTSSWSTAGLVNFTRLDTALGESVTSSGMASGFGLAFTSPDLLPGG
ncbi:MAG: peptidylprolyl isomerase [Phycisphaerales bacterium]|nr:peptidylprolyl isomerase [Phycisphaerales bacterium]